MYVYGDLSFSVGIASDQETPTPKKQRGFRYESFLSLSVFHSAIKFFNSYFRVKVVSIEICPIECFVSVAPDKKYSAGQIFYIKSGKGSFN